MNDFQEHIQEVVKKATDEGYAAGVVGPIITTVGELEFVMARFNLGKPFARAWADLQTWLWKNPQRSELN